MYFKTLSIFVRIRGEKITLSYIRVAENVLIGRRTQNFHLHASKLRENMRLLTF